MLEVQKDYDEVGGDVQKLVEKYHSEMEAIKKSYGGSIGDIPTNRDEPYWKLQAKLYAVHTLMKDSKLGNAKSEVELGLPKDDKGEGEPSSDDTKKNVWG